MSSSILHKLSAALCDCQMPLHGFCSFDALKDSLLPCRAADRLNAVFPPKHAARTIIVALFPYRYSDEPGNLSRYARVPDYHHCAGDVLTQAAASLEQAFSPFRFLPFLDNSPLPEVRAAALAGLGCRGDNGLLIHPVYGSWVFIGTLVTDLDLCLPHQEDIPGCLHCGACSAACPGNCRLGTNASRETCLSRLTQQKQPLTPQEQTLIRAAGTAWGCDRCQDVCPLNRRAEIQPHPCFTTNFAPSLTRDDLNDLTDKAYGWRGRGVPERNLELLEMTAHHNIVENSARRNAHDSTL